MIFPNLIIRRLLSNYSQTFTSDKGRKFLQRITEVVDPTTSNYPTSAIIPYDDGCCRRISMKHSELLEQWGELDVLASLKIEAKTDKQLLNQIEREAKNIESAIDRICEELFNLVIQENEFDSMSMCQLELSSGVGGIEAGLFTGELFALYQSFAQRRNWIWQPIRIDFFNENENAIRHAEVAMRGPKIYSIMKFEAGVHRVQRNPITDPSRIHTSTSSVIVMPESEDDPEIIFQKGELKVDCIKASGPGGQNVNKTNSAVKITHKPTGIIVHSMQDRFQINNMKIAKQKLMSKLLQLKVDEIDKSSKLNRQLQATSKSWADKIRTYNYREKRVVDHRVKYETRKLEEFLRGGDCFDELIKMFEEIHRMDRLQETIEKLICDEEIPEKKTSRKREKSF